MERKEALRSCKIVSHAVQLGRFKKCCSHRPVAGFTFSSLFSTRKRPVGPWLQQPQFYLNSSSKMEIYTSTIQIQERTSYLVRRAMRTGAGDESLR